MKHVSVVAGAVAAALALSVPAAQAAGPAVSFSQPQFISKTLAGGEPTVMADLRHGTLVYTSHEGTTHLYGPGFFSPVGVPNFILNYRNQVNIWTSSDGGATWQLDDLGGSGFNTDPSKSTGFSDPDLTLDEGGRMYDTGIDLANDSLFSSQDGGKTWDKGTAQCHDGDRPWLAGAGPNTAFLATDTVEGSGSGHQIFESTDGGNSCSSTGTPDNGPFSGGGTFTGFGKLAYDHNNGMLVEPALFDSNGDGNFDNGVGVSVGKFGDPKFTPVKVSNDQVYAHWPAIAIDSADNIYLVWDTADHSGATSQCGNPAPTPNSIKLAVSTNFGKTFSQPITIAHPGNARVFWPWVTVGDPGKISIVWYQNDRVVDVDCQPSNVFAYDAQVFNATDPAHAQITVANASGRPLTQNSVCQGGTGCVAESFDPSGSKDRRLGDYFTNAVDQHGCVIIASGDTTQKDPVSGQTLPVSLPVFIRQSSGPPLVGSTPCKPLARQGVGGRCADRIAPTTTYRRGRPRFSPRHQLVLRGRTRDRGCGGGVRAVQIAFAKRKVGPHQSRRTTKACRFLRANGRFTKPRSCSHKVWLRAHGTRRWRFVVRRHLRRGFYEVWARGIDRAFNKERITRRNTRTFRIAGG